MSVVRLIRRQKEKPHLIQEYLPEIKMWCDPISLFTEVAIERNRFVAFADTGVAGWQTSPKDNIHEYARVNILESDWNINDDDDD